MSRRWSLLHQGGRHGLHGSGGHVLDLAPGPTGQGVVGDDAGVIRQAQHLGAVVRRAGESGRNDGDRRPPELLQLYAVVETPRDAGPSVSHPVHDRITRLHEALDGRRR
jgi:hypothetical protein